ISVFSAAENDLVKAGSFLLGVASKAESLFNSAEKSAPAVSSAAVPLFTDVEALSSLAAPAVGSEGLNFAADSAAYAQFLKVVADAKAFVAASATAVK